MKVSFSIVQIHRLVLLSRFWATEGFAKCIINAWQCKYASVIQIRPEQCKIMQSHAKSKQCNVAQNLLSSKVLNWFDCTMCLCLVRVPSLYFGSVQYSCGTWLVSVRCLQSIAMSTQSTTPPFPAQSRVASQGVLFSSFSRCKLKTKHKITRS